MPEEVLIGSVENMMFAKGDEADELRRTDISDRCMQHCRPCYACACGRAHLQGEELWKLS